MDKAFVLFVGLKIPEARDFGGNVCRCFVGNLAAFRVIYFIAVVFLGVMACGDDDSRRGFQLSHRIGEDGRGRQLVENIRLYSLGGKNFGDCKGKLAGFDAAVVRDRHALFFSRLFQEIGRQSKRSLSHRIDVHAVGACPQNAAKPSRPEGQLAVKPVLDGFCVAFDGKQLLVQLAVRAGMFQPFFIQRFNHSFSFSLCSIFKTV